MIMGKIRKKRKGDLSINAILAICVILLLLTAGLSSFFSVSGSNAKSEKIVKNYIQILEKNGELNNKEKIEIKGDLENLWSNLELEIIEATDKDDTVGIIMKGTLKNGFGGTGYSKTISETGKYKKE